MTVTSVVAILSLAMGGAEPDTTRAKLDLPSGNGSVEPHGVEASTAEVSPSDDYLLHPPVLSVTVRGGAAFPMADSDFFDFVTDELTLEPQDFDGAKVGFDLAVHISSRTDFISSFSYTHGSADSRYRHEDEAIEQWTRLQQAPLTAGLRVFPLGRGRQVGDFVWIPDSFRPYVGGAVGVVFYRLVQDGEWLDVGEDPNLPLEQRVFQDRFESDGWGRALHALAGVEWGITPRFALTLEGRYQGATADLGDQFEGFEPLDLHGAHVTLGMTYAF